MKKLILILALFSSTFISFAGDKLLKPEEAFKSSVRLSKPGIYEVSFAIADGYQLYKEKFKVLEGESENENITLTLPDADTLERFDKALEKNVKYYKGQVRATIKFPDGYTPKTDLFVQVQGCEATKGICYPPMSVNLNKATSSSGSFLDFIASKFSN